MDKKRGDGNSIIVSEIDITPIKPKDGLLGFASCVINHSFYLGNLAIHRRIDGGIRIVYPQKALENGKRIDLFHPINREAGSQVASAIATEYERLMKEGSLC